MRWVYNKEDYLYVLSQLGLILVIISFVMLIPVVIAIIYQEYVAYRPFLAGSVLSALLGVLFRLLTHVYFNFYSSSIPFERKHAIGMVVLIWPLVSIPSALPLYLLKPAGQDISFLDAFFESVSGWTTTGLTTFGGEASYFLHSVNFWRHFMQYLGGLGIIVMGLIILMPLKRWEDTMEIIVATGRDYRISPSLSNTIKLIGGIYLVLMVAGTILFRGAGMETWFDSLCHSMSGLSTGGYSVNSNSFEAYYHSPTIVLAALPIMVAGNTNFVLTYYMLRGRIKTYFKDIESQTFWSLLIFFTSIFFILYVFEHENIWFVYEGRNYAGFYDVIFNVASALTTTGWNSVPYSVWSGLTFPVIFLIILISMIVGANTSSTGGGLKAMRVGVMLKSIYWQIEDIVLPKSIVSKKRIHHLEKKYIADENIIKIFTFATIYFIILFISFVIFLLHGYGFFEALFEVTSAIGTVGLSSGVTSMALEPVLKIVLIINMWLGRIEVLPLFYFIRYILGRKL